MSNSARQIPLGSGLRKVERNGGETFDVADAQFTWKVKGEHTGYAFSIYERELHPGEEVPLHCHAYGEVFYALSGTIDFLRVADAAEEWITCTSGETIIVPTNALHAFYNRTEQPARLLSISTQLHQAFSTLSRRRIRPIRLPRCLDRKRWNASASWPAVLTCTSSRSHPHRADRASDRRSRKPTTSHGHSSNGRAQR